jgi:hypothetical protein
VSPSSCGSLAVEKELLARAHFVIVDGVVDELRFITGALCGPLCLRALHELHDKRA